MNQHPNLLSIFGRDGIEDSVIEQMNTCLEAGVGRGDETLGVLCADAHQGYSCPIGGVVAYDKHVSPNLVGFDIGCGNHAIKLDVDAGDVDVPKVMDAIWERIPFGMTREQIAFDASPYGRDVLQRIKDSELKVVRSLYDKAYSQLGSVGGGNHFVNLMRGESDGKLWIANHFGSRGFGHTLATHFLEEIGAEDGIFSPPALIDADSRTGRNYFEAMDLACEYARVGRDMVLFAVKAFIEEALRHDVRVEAVVRNNHNDCHREKHGEKDYYVHRKGATSAWAGQYGFVGGSMGDISVIVQGKDKYNSPFGKPRSPSPHLRSTIHGAGRQMSRTEAKGKQKRRWTCSNRDCDWRQRHGEHKPQDGQCPKCAKDNLTKQWFTIQKGKIDYDEVQDRLSSEGIEIRGGGADEAPGAYKRIEEVLDHHKGTIDVVETLNPLGVAMAE